MARKSFDKELMYKKIMPTNLKKSMVVDEEGKENSSVAINDEMHPEGLVSINANVVYLNEISKSDEENKIISKDFQNSAVGAISTIPNDETKKVEVSGIIIYNVMVNLVVEKLGIVLKKMNCCKCERCKDDIVAVALNSLKPMYVVGTRDEIDNRKEEFSKLGLEVTTAVLKAVLLVRRKPNH